jgi:hypothetical protein
MSEEEFTDHVYKCNCTTYGVKGIDINKMKDMSRSVTYETMKKHCDIDGILEKCFPGIYAKRKNDGLTIKNDWHIRYSKSYYKGQPCYYFTHSGIEYIFVRRGDERLCL